MTSIGSLFEAQQTFFQRQATLPLSVRRNALTKLQRALREQEPLLLQAARQDLGKSAIETFTSELGLVEAELRLALRSLSQWTEAQERSTPWRDRPGQSLIVPEPKGVVLILGPWNYPFALTLLPLIGALAAGNCALVKPSELATASGLALQQVVRAALPEEHAAVVLGNAEVAQELLTFPWDHIFFTGSTAVGRKVMQAASAHLVPLTLELGGKSPCLVLADSDPVFAAERIAWGKFLNAGQTCVAPDFVLVEKKLFPRLVEQLQAALQRFFGKDPHQSPDYGRIVNDRHFDRLVGYLANVRVLSGGEPQRADRYFPPTLITDADWDSPVMTEEIFGPVLPILAFDDLDAALLRLRQRPKPLALYVFTGNPVRAKSVLERLPSGTAAINDTIIQIANPQLPFGGLGASGMGVYHGRATFDAFTHYRSVVLKPQQPGWVPRFPPFGISFGWLKRFYRWLS